MSPTTTFFLDVCVWGTKGGASAAYLSASGIYRKHERAKFFAAACLDRNPWDRGKNPMALNGIHEQTSETKSIKFGQNFPFA